MSEANIVRVSHESRWACEPVGIDFTERFRVAVGCEFIRHGNRIITSPFWRRHEGLRDDAQNGRNNGIEPLRLAGLLAFARRHAEPMIAAARIENP